MEYIGHRGSVTTGGPPENTLAAVAAALAAGADGVEVDVRLTVDDIAVLHHDADLRRVAGSPRRVDRSSYRDLRRVRLPGGHEVAKLDDAISLVPRSRLLVLDLKWEPGAEPAVAAATVRALRRAGRVESVVVSSFSPLVLAAVRDRNPLLRRALITGPGVPAVVALHRVINEGYGELHAEARTVLADHTVAERAAAAGRPLRGWTVNRSVDARLLGIAGVPAVVCDDPGALRRARLDPAPAARRG